MIYNVFAENILSLVKKVCYKRTRKTELLEYIEKREKNGFDR